MHESDSDPLLAAEGELALAKLALDSGDQVHAANHLSNAVASAPQHPEVLEAITALVSTQGAGALELFPLEGSVYLGTVVARSHVLACLGEHAQALGLLAMATTHAPGGLWSHAGWVSEPVTASMIDPDALVQILGQLLGGLDDPVDDQERFALSGYLSLATNAIAKYPNHARLHGFASSLARRMGQNETALAWARRGVEVEPSSMGELFVGMACRAADLPDEAAAAMQRAIALDPANLAIYSDLAELLSRNGKLDEALAWIARARSVDPDYDCVVHVGQRLLFERDQDARHLIALADYARDNPSRACKHDDLAQACSGHSWLGYVPNGTESCINVLQQVLEKGEIQGGASMAISGFEPPSAVAEFKRLLPGSSISFNEIGEPDGRRALRPGVHIWRYQDETAEPTVAPPSESAVAVICDTVSFSLQDPIWTYDRAVALAGLSEQDLLGLLVHPPAVPTTGHYAQLNDYPGLWPRMIQTWSCVGLLHHRTDEPWPDSRRRQLLVDLLFGPEDWATEAALFALVVAAWVDPSIRPDIASIVRDRFDFVREAWGRRPITIVGSLACLALATPDLDEQTRAFATEILSEDQS